jgi:hypothetical protein
VVVCIALGVNLGDLFGEGPCPPLYSLGEQGYMEVLARYELRSPTRVLFGQFSSVSTSSTMVRVVTTDVGRGPCPIPYPGICTPYAQSRHSGSDNWFCFCGGFFLFLEELFF